MIFTVPEDFEGSFVSNTLKRALSGGMSISIYGNDLYAPDVKMAIKKGILVPVGDEYEKSEHLGSTAMVVNRTDRVLVLGAIILRPWASLLVNKDTIADVVFQSAEDNGFIHIVSDEKSFASKKFKKSAIKDREQNKVSEEVFEEDFEEEIDEVDEEEVEEEAEEEEAEEEEAEEDAKPEFVVGAERNVKAKVWNFREQEQEDAAIVPTTPDIINVTEEEHEDLDFVDEEEEEVKPVAVKKRVAKKKAKKKAVKKAVKKGAKKKAVKKTSKKKVSTTKKKKVKALEPVGDSRSPKTQMDAAIELDSRGRPLVDGASDALNHLIDSAGAPEDVSFVDGEQAQDRYDRRTDMD